MPELGATELFHVVAITIILIVIVRSLVRALRPPPGKDNSK